MMRKNCILTMFVALGISISSCSSVSKVQHDSMLEKIWTHDTEESTEQYDLYRPSDYKVFPPSRYRQVFDFKKDGVCAYLFLEPTDGHMMRIGKWNLDEKTNSIKIYDQHAVLLYQFEVVEMSDDLLKLKAKN